VNERSSRRGPRQPAEGVRIIGAEEAQAALDAGSAAGRKPEDQLRFGDVPPAPSGPRPAHRFPLPHSVDPANAVPLPPLAPTGRRAAPESPPIPEIAEEGSWSVPEPATAEEAASPAVSPWSADDWLVGDRTAELSVPAEHSLPPVGLSADEGITVSGGGAELPHWTDPPTGEVPRILPDSGAEEEEDDLEAWKALGSRGVRWRDAEEDWDQADEMADLAGDDDPIGVLDQTRSEQSDLYSFDEDFERVASRSSGSVPVVTDYDDQEGGISLEHEVVTPVPGPRHARARRPRPEPPVRGRSRLPGGPGDAGSNEMGSRVAVGVGLIILLAIAYAIGPVALIAYSALVIVAAVAEGYGMLQRAGFRPATLLGLIGTLGVVFGAYWRGIEALPIVMVLVFAGAMMWYVLGIVEARPLANVAVTVMVFVWVAVLGSFAGVMLREVHGKGLFLGAVLIAVAADAFAFGVGRWIGSRPMAESISPNKTVEGFFGGLVGALILGAIVGKWITPWGGMRHGLVLGLVVGLIAPAGDLFESMIKRDLGVKDSGTILPGHGGLLDRFDSILLALPAAYFVASIFHIPR
jgi:phosphatidate cytidylyltransferase